MRPTTEAYKKEIRSPIMANQYMRVEFGLISPTARLYHKYLTNSQKPYSSFERIVDDQLIVEDSYATFENNRLKADGRLLIPPKDPKEFLFQGWVSDILSNEAGQYPAGGEPWVNISFEDDGATILLDFPGITLTFDDVMKMHPTKIKVHATRLNNTVYENTFNISSYIFVEVIPMKNVDNIRITFLSTQEPFQYVRLMNVKYGIGMVWDGNSIHMGKGITKTVDIDPINRRLPVSKINVNLLDYEHFFDLDNPTGIYDVVESQLPIEIFYGKEIPDSMNWSDVNEQQLSNVYRNTWGKMYEGGYIEWFNVGTYLLDSKPRWENNVAELNGRDLIGYMTDEYYKGIYGRRSLWDLAIDVFTDAELIPRDDGQKNYVLWDGLKGIYSDSPMPILPHNECLRLIAHAGNCVYYTDWQNIVHIEPMDMTQHDYDLDFQFQMNGAPVAEMTPSLYAVDSEITYWREDTNDDGSIRISTLHEETIEIFGEYPILRKFNPAVDITVTVEGGTVLSESVYSQAAELRISASGTVRIIISGVLLLESKGVERVLNVGGDERGEIEILSNALVTDRQTAKAQAEYVKNWLRLRTAYQVQYRGDPAVEALDVVYGQSTFTPKFSTRVLKHDWTYTGGLTGNMIIKNLESAR